MECKNVKKLEIYEIATKNNICRKVIREKTGKDKILTKILKYIKNEWKEPEDGEGKNYYSDRAEITEENGILEYRNRIIIPESLRKVFLKIFHRTHFGISKTRARARKLIY